MNQNLTIWIEGNKQLILEYLKGKSFQSEGEIMRGYMGQRDIQQVREALFSLKKEGKVTYKMQYTNSKHWKLKQIK